MTTSLTQKVNACAEEAANSVGSSTAKVLMAELNLHWGAKRFMDLVPFVGLLFL